MRCARQATARASQIFWSVTSSSAYCRRGCRNEANCFSLLRSRKGIHLAESPRPAFRALRLLVSRDASGAAVGASVSLFPFSQPGRRIKTELGSPISAGREQGSSRLASRESFHPGKSPQIKLPRHRQVPRVQLRKHSMVAVRAERHDPTDVSARLSQA